MSVDLSKIPADCQSIVFVTTIYDAVVREQDFGLVNNACIHVVD